VPANPLAMGCWRGGRSGRGGRGRGGIGKSVCGLRHSTSTLMQAGSAPSTGISSPHIMGTELQPAALAAAAGNAALRSAVTVKNANTTDSTLRRFLRRIVESSLLVASNTPSRLFATGAMAPRMAKTSLPTMRSPLHDAGRKREVELGGNRAPGVQSSVTNPGEARMQKGYPVRGSPRIYLAGFWLQQPQSAGAAGRLWALRCRAQIGSAQDRGPKVLVLESCCPVARPWRGMAAMGTTWSRRMRHWCRATCDDLPYRTTVLLKVCTCHNVVMIRGRRHGLLHARTYHPACLPVITKYSTSRLVTQDPLGTKGLLACTLVTSLVESTGRESYNYARIW